MVEAHFDARVFDNRDAEGKRDDVERGDGRFLLDTRTPGNEMPAERDKRRREQSPEQQPGRREADHNRRQCQARKKRVRERVGHQGEAAHHHKRAEESVGKSDQHAGQQGALHEFVLERFEQPVHAWSWW